MISARERRQASGQSACRWFALENSIAIGTIITQRRLRVVRTAAVLFLALLATSCQSAPPYISPLPANTQTNQWKGVQWSPSADPYLLSYNIRDFPPGATSWQLYATTSGSATNYVFTPAQQSNILFGTAFCISDTDSNSLIESDGGPQITNNVVTKPASPTNTSPQ